MIKKIILFVLILSLHPLLGQTKKIAYKSHSGTADAFALALEHHLFDIDLHNEGLNEEAYEMARKMELNHLPDTFITLKKQLLPSYKSVLLKDSLFSETHITDSVHGLFKKQIPVTEKKSTENTRDEQLFTPVSNHNNTNPPNSGTPALYIGIVGLLALFSGLFSWQYKHV